MKKPTNRKPMRVGEILLKEVAYQNKGAIVGYRVEATWKDPPAIRKSGSDGRRKEWLPNWRAAEEFAAKQGKAIEEANGKTAFTFNDAADGWIKQQELRAKAKDSDLSEGALYQKRHNLEKARARFGKMLVHDIKSEHVSDWLLEQGEHLKRNTLSLRLYAVKQVLRYAQERGMLAVNPLLVLPVKPPGRKSSKRVDVPDRSDMDKLRLFVDGARPSRVPHLTWSSFRVAVVLGGTCGMRVGEVCGLRWDRIDPEMGEVEITDVVENWPTIRIKERPKTDAGFRRIPLTPRAREIIDEHAVIYREFHGDCVGHVVRSYTGNSRREFSEPNTVSQLFTEMMKRAGIVKADGTPKFGFHALRHWCASVWVKHDRDVHRVSKMIGHTNTSMTLDTYGHFIADPEGHAKYQAMPTWLDPLVQIDAPAQAIKPALPAPDSLIVNGGHLAELAAPIECPMPLPDHAERAVKIFVRDLWRHGRVHDALRTARKGRQEVRYELRRLGLPTIDELEAMARADLEGKPEVVALEVDQEEAEMTPISAAPPCPLDLPDLAADFVPVYLCHLDSGMSQEAACLAIRKGWHQVNAELKRIGLPGTAELKRRMRLKRVVALVDQGYQDSDIARMLGTKRQAIWKARTQLHKETAANALKPNKKRRTTPRVDTRTEHKSQFKLL